MCIYVPLMIIIIMVLYLKIRKKKLTILQFFLNIPSKSFEEILGSIDKFNEELVSSELELDNANSHEDIDKKTVDNEIASTLSLTHAHYTMKYKKHRLNSKRNLDDTCFNIVMIVLRFVLMIILICGYFTIYWFTIKNISNHLENTGYLLKISSRIELESINSLVLLMESVKHDSNTTGNFYFYRRLQLSIVDSILLIKDLEDVKLYLL